MQQVNKNISVSKDAEIVELDKRVKKEFRGSSWRGRKKTADWNAKEDAKFLEKTERTEKANSAVTEDLHRERYDKAVSYAKKHTPGILNQVKQEYLKANPNRELLHGKQEHVRKYF